jgi:hypothetical protein
MFGDLINPSEFLGLVLCLLILLYVVYNNSIFLKDQYAFITYGFFCIAGSFFLTNLEEFLLEDLLNVLEHTFSSAAALYVAVGCRRLMPGGKGEGEKAS